MSDVLRARLLTAAAVTVLAAAACTTAGASHGTGLAQRWHTFTQPPGPMLLTFSYPPGWQASGHTFVSTMGNVGVAEVTGATAATIAQFKNASSCRLRVELLDGSGADITWSANVGSPAPIRLSAMGGRRVRVNGDPARLAEAKSSLCGPETLVNGMIQTGSQSFLYMHADVGARAKPGTLAAVRKIFFSARP
jgi:hypothetical protein